MHDADLGRVTISNDDGDVYVESTGEDSEIVLKTQKVRVLGDVYYNDLNVGFSARLDTVDETLTNRIDTLDATQLELRGVDAGLSSRIDALDDSKAELQRVDTEVAALIASLNATDLEMKTKDTELSGRIDTLDITDAELKLNNTQQSLILDRLYSLLLVEKNDTCDRYGTFRITNMSTILDCEGFEFMSCDEIYDASRTLCGSKRIYSEATCKDFYHGYLETNPATTSEDPFNCYSQYMRKESSTLPKVCRGISLKTICDSNSSIIHANS